MNLRLGDPTVYLRAASVNLINGLVCLNFSCDGTHYMPAQEFLAKDPAARKRIKREMALDLRDRLKAPIITSDELGSEFTASTRHAVKFVGHPSLVLIALFLVFRHQAEILDLLGGTLHAEFTWLTAVAVVVFVPVFAFLYGSVTQLALRLLRIE